MLIWAVEIALCQMFAVAGDVRNFLFLMIPCICLLSLYITFTPVLILGDSLNRDCEIMIIIH